MTASEAWTNLKDRIPARAELFINYVDAFSVRDGKPTSVQHWMALLGGVAGYGDTAEKAFEQALEVYERYANNGVHIVPEKAA